MPKPAARTVLTCLQTIDPLIPPFQVTATISISLYYDAKRDRRLNDVENRRLDAIVAEFGKSAEIERHEASGKGLNWESFTLYDADGLRDGKVLAGATKLPDNKAFAVHQGARHWVDCLNRIRREVLADAVWSVQIDDKALLWDDKSGWHDEASDGLASLWLGCLLSAPFRLFAR
ncbi:hypothetical protein LC55x_1293 [Lysobacter capsici]|nr:hypothetical protein LC55x_1293 [Lysobacter capsici]